MSRGNRNVGVYWQGKVLACGGAAQPACWLLFQLNRQFTGAMVDWFDCFVVFGSIVLKLLWNQSVMAHSMELTVAIHVSAFVSTKKTQS